ncbi:hypothetical protein MNBD_GAMMA04-1852 [hydrothermal vent metagenome]|uniref:L,D-TPase catalytic domain-containing protein n=1 Tax=hydrothermal vent metagenome TaxID=652676 RepID=A0A3B0VRX8_9ZZZZ
MKKVKKIPPPPLLLVLALGGLLSFSSVADDVLLAEKQLLSGLKSIQNLSVDRALDEFNDLSERYPNYKLVQLLRADLLALKSGQSALMATIHQKNPRTVGRLQSEAAVRWQFSQSEFPNDRAFENYVLKMGEQPNFVLADLSENRLYLYERDANGKMQQVTNYYISMGRAGAGKQKEGDRGTPLGVYHIIELLPDSEVSELYGIGALPINYPNDWDLKKGRTGSGIWLHGTPRDTYIRDPNASRGCVVLNNQAMEKLLSMYRLPFETPFLIVDSVDDLSHTEGLNNQSSKDLVLLEVKNWLNSHYVGVNWESVSVYRYPNEEGLLYVTFPMRIENKWVHQYWQRGDNGSWKLVIESQSDKDFDTKA